MMNKLQHILVSLLFFAPALAYTQAHGQDNGARRDNAPLDRKEVRSGNRGFRKGHFKEAEIEYRRALVKDSLSVAGNYNLANTLYRMEDYQNAAKYVETAETAENPDIFFNKGDIALQNKDYNTAVDAFKQALLLNPGDLDAKENYIYARKMLEDQQQNQNNQNQDQNQDNKDQNNQDNQDQNKDNQDQQDQNQPDNNQNQDNKDQNQRQQPQDQQLTPQAAQQMLQAIEAKEKETQDKVKKEEALRMKSRQKEKNW